MREKEDKLDKLFKGYYKSKPAGHNAIHADFDMSESNISKVEGICSSREETCPEIAMLSAYVEGSLGKTEMESISLHIAHCKTCKEKVESASKTMKDMQENRLEKAPGHLSIDISKLSPHKPKTPPKEEK